MNVDLVALGFPSVPMQSFNPWDDPPVVYSETAPCFAEPPPPSRLIEISTEIRNTRPDLTRFVLLARCSVFQDPDVGKARWQLSYSLSVPSDLPIDGKPQNNRAQSRSTVLPFVGEGILSFDGAVRHLRSACTISMQETEMYSAEEWAIEEQARRLRSDIYEESSESDDNSERDWQEFRG